MLAEKIGYQYFAPFILAIGIIGSLANLITLSHRKFSGRLYVYLKALSVADLASLSFASSNIINILMHHNTDGSKNYIAIYYMAHFENALINGFLSSSVFIIVCMTLDR